MAQATGFGLPALPSLSSYARNPYGAAHMANSLRKQQQSTDNLELDPAVEESIAKKAGRVALGGIGAAANLLGLPGSMALDTITGHNPFDQLATPFSPDNRMRGRDAGRQWGLMDKKDTWGNFFGGLAIDIATDPLTYVNPFGALTKGGKIAEAAGLSANTMKTAATKMGRPIEQLGKREAALNTTLDDLLKGAGPEATQAAQRVAAGMNVNMADVLNQPLRGALGVGFMGKNMGVFGTGVKSQKLARGLDKLGAAVRYARIPGTTIEPMNAMSRLFTSALSDTKTRLAQSFARQLFEAKTATGAKASWEVGGYVNDLVKAGHATDAEGDMLREFLEIKTPNTPIPQELDAVVKRVIADEDRVYQAAYQKGVAPEFYDTPFARHIPRHSTDRAGGASGKAYSTFSGDTPEAQSRLWFFRPFTDPKTALTHAIDGETGTIKKLLMDPRLDAVIEAGGKRKEIRRFIIQEYGQLIPSIGSKTGKTASDRWTGLAKWIEGLSPESRKIGVFGNHPLVDILASRTASYDAMAASDTIRDLLASPGVRQSAAGAANASELVDIKQVLKELKINAGGADGGFALSLADVTPMPQGGGMLGDTVRALAQTDPVAADDMLKSFLNFQIKKDVAADLLNFRKPFASPEPANEIMKAVHSVTNLWKGFQTAVAPAFHTRNLVSGQYQNAVSGTFSLSSIADTHALLKGNIIEGSKNWPVIKDLATTQGITNLTDQQATDLIGQLVYSHKMSARFSGEGRAVAGGTDLQPAGIEALLQQIPGRGVSHIQPGRIARKAVAREPGTNWKFWRARGFNDLPESEFGPLAAGDELSGVVEGFNRIAPFLHQIKRGIEPGAAAAKVGAAQVMYQARYFTKFEQQAMATAFPFYKFSSKVMPWTLRQLIENPTGGLGTTLRVANRLRNPDEMTPDYVAETTAVPLGESPDGSKRYLTGAGLMAEDPLSFLGSGLRGGLLEAGSRLNPLVKMPLEWGTGQSFFQKGPMGGRQLTDMDPTIGRTLANLTGQKDAVKWPGSEGMEFLLGNSPLSRAASSVRTMTGPLRTLTDPTMKGQLGTEALKTAANLGTGFRITNVSPAAQEGILRERVQTLMRQAGGKQFTRAYIPKETLAAMSPEERVQAIQLQSVINTLAKRSKARAAAKKLAEAKQ